jgi:hypothetical protein
VAIEVEPMGMDANWLASFGACFANVKVQSHSRDPAEIVLSSTRPQ